MGDIDDSHLTDEQIRTIIRDDYIKESDVFVLLCGKNTKHRKHIDWEIHAAMYRSELKKPLPILVVNVSSSNNGQRSCEENEKQYIDNTFGPCVWISCRTRADFIQFFPDMPERIIDSFETKYSNISVVNFTAGISVIKEFIKNAYSRRNSYEYNDSRVLRRHNGAKEESYVKSIY